MNNIQDAVEAIETLRERLKYSNEISFTQLCDDRDTTTLTISTKRFKGDEVEQVRLELAFQGDDVIELKESSKDFLEKDIMNCLAVNARKIETLKFAFIDDRLPFFINSVNDVFVKRNQPIRKLILDCCGSQRREDTASIFDPKILLDVCQLTDEFHLDYEDRELGNPHDLPLFLSVLSQVKSLKTISLSSTYAEDTEQLTQVLQSNSKLKEFILYNAFSKNTIASLNSLVEAMKLHVSLRKFTLLHTKLPSFIYRWAINTILQNKHIMGFCTDGYYSQNATWLARFLGTNNQVTEVNLSHPQFEDDYDRVSTSGATLSLIQALSRNSVLKSVKLVGIPVNEETAKAICTLIERNESIEKFACGNNFMMPGCLSLIIGGVISNTSIKHLSIQSLDLDLVGAQTLVDLLRSNVTLESLSLGANRRRYLLRPRRRTNNVEVEPTQVAQVLAEGLKANSTLKLLSLPANMNNESCMDHFARVLEKENTTLEGLRFYHKIPCESRKVNYLTLLNHCGRKHLVQSSSVPLGLWANVFAAKNNADLVQYFCMEQPTLFDCRSTIKRSDELCNTTTMGQKRLKIG